MRMYFAHETETEQFDVGVGSIIIVRRTDGTLYPTRVPRSMKITLDLEEGTWVDIYAPQEAGFALPVLRYITKKTDDPKSKEANRKMIEAVEKALVHRLN